MSILLHILLINGLREFFKVHPWFVDASNTGAQSVIGEKKANGLNNLLTSRHVL